MKRLFALSLALIMLAGTGMAFAQPGHHRPDHNMDGPMMMGPMGHIEKALDLTEDQLSKMTDYRIELKKEVLPLRSELVEKRNELHLALTEDSPNQAKINKTIDAIGQIHRDMQKYRVDFLLKVKSLLTDEQKTRFNLMILDGPRGKMGKGKPGKGFRR